ncbi:hypothetical protein Hanom_Chr08g00725161 [Helianthus anomalus]
MYLISRYITDISVIYRLLVPGRDIGAKYRQSLLATIGSVLQVAKG